MSTTRSSIRMSSITWFQLDPSTTSPSMNLRWTMRRSIWFTSTAAKASAKTMEAMAKHLRQHTQTTKRDSLMNLQATNLNQTTITPTSITTQRKKTLLMKLAELKQFFIREEEEVLILDTLPINMKSISVDNMKVQVLQWTTTITAILKVGEQEVSDLLRRDTIKISMTNQIMFIVQTAINNNILAELAIIWCRVNKAILEAGEEVASMETSEIWATREILSRVVKVEVEDFSTTLTTMKENLWEEE